MISSNLITAVNKQIKAEMYSANLYLSMAAYFQSEGLQGFSHWMRVQYEEETQHALKFNDYLLMRGGAVQILAIEEPPHTWSSPLDVFEHVLQHEQLVSKMINDLVYLAREERDYAAEVFLHWFVTEQVEEEENDRDIIAKLKLIGSESHGLLMLDAELATRPSPPPITAAPAGA